MLRQRSAFDVLHSKNMFIRGNKISEGEKFIGHAFKPCLSD